LINRATNPSLTSEERALADVRLKAKVAARVANERTFTLTGKMRQARSASPEVAEDFQALRSRMGALGTPGLMNAEWLTDTQKALREASSSPGTARGQAALRSAKSFIASGHKAASREEGLQTGDQQRASVGARLTAAQGALDVSKLDTLTAGLFKTALKLQTDLASFSREELAGPRGKRMLKEYGQATRAQESAVTQQTRAVQQQAATAHRDSSLIQTAGLLYGYRRVSTGLQGMVGSDLSSIPGRALHTAGAFLEARGLGMAGAARAEATKVEAARLAAGGAPGAGASGGGLGVMAGLGMSGVGTVAMIAGKLLTAGLSRGYENTAKMDKIMATAEPLFDLRGRQFNVGEGRAPTTSIGQLYVQSGGGGTAVMSEGEARRKAKQYSADLRLGVADNIPDSLIAEMITDRRARDADAGISTTQRQSMKAAADHHGINTSKGVRDAAARAGAKTETYLGNAKLRRTYIDASSFSEDDFTAALSGSLAYRDEHGSANRRANASLDALKRLGMFGLETGAALDAYQGFSGSHGVTGRTLSQDVAAMVRALKMGATDNLSAQGIRVGRLTGESGDLNPMIAALTRRGVMGTPQHQVIEAIQSQIEAGYSKGLSGSLNVGANSLDAMLKSGVSYAAIPGLRAQAASNQEYIANITGDPMRKMIQGFQTMNAIKRGGGTLKGMNKYNARSDSMQGFVEGWNSMHPMLQEMAASALFPNESEAIQASMKNMGGMNLAGTPTTDEGLVPEDNVFGRWTALTQRAFGLIGTESKIADLDTREKWSMALDSAANALRSLADSAIP